MKEEQPQDLSGDYDLVSKFHLKKEEEQLLSAEEVLMKIYGHKEPLTGERLTVFLDHNSDIIQAMHEYRDQGRDRKPSSKELNTL